MTTDPPTATDPPTGTASPAVTAMPTATATARPGARSAVPVSGSLPGRLLRAELLKVFTTNAWWIFAICAGMATGLALLIDCVAASSELEAANNPPDFGASAPPGTPGPSQADLDQAAAEWKARYALPAVLVRNAANIDTAGQFFGLLIVMLVGAVLVTNEYFHQTATATFLATPRRVQVILAKFAAATVLATALWLVITAVDLATSAIYFSAKGYPNSLGDWPVLRSILLNLLGYAVWAVFGVGLGALIRSQIGATVTAAGLYLVGGNLALVAFQVLHAWSHQDWVLTASVAIPSVASQIMITPERVFDQAPPQWVGALVLIGYALASTAIGAAIVRRRDIS